MTHHALHTAGEWYWHIDHNGCASLRTPDRGNLVVMDFARKGMRSAQPRFAEWPGMYSGVPRERVGGILKDAERWRNDARGIDHPDAMLIVAAPNLLAALQPFVGHNSSEETVTLTVRTADVTRARAAILIATGSRA